MIPPSPPPSPSSWIAVCPARELGRRPRRVVMDGTPIVVFRSGEGIAALPDMCPHRFAPLSLGRVCDGRIECPYHGWQFDASGQCRVMPGVLGEMPRVRVAPLAACEHDGLIFVSRDKPDGAPYAGRLSGRGSARLMVSNRVQSTLVDAAENILDATHTHFTHKGLLRGLGARRYRVHVTVTGGPGWVEARYEGETRQEGLVSRLLEAGRGVSIGRFLAPGIAEIEFWGRGARWPNLVTTFHLRQETADRVAGVGILSGPTDHGLGYVKAAAFMPLFRIGVAQDQHILGEALRNRARFGDPRPMIGPLDILRASIEAIVRGEPPPVAARPFAVEMEL